MKTSKKKVRKMRDMEMVALIQRGGRDGPHVDRRAKANKEGCRKWKSNLDNN